MYLLLLGVALVVLKFSELGPVANWAWWEVLVPFGLAVVWWAWADWSGLTKSAIARREEKRKMERIARAQAATGQPSKAPRPHSLPRR